MTSSPSASLLDYTLLFAIGVTGGLGDIWIFQWTRTPRWQWLFAASAVWMLSLFLFAALLMRGNRTFGAAFILSTVLHIVLVVLCDCAWFGTRPSRTEWFGMLLALFSIVLLEIGHQTESHLEANSQSQNLAAEIPNEGERPE